MEPGSLDPGASASAGDAQSASYGETAAGDDEAAEGDTPRGESWTYDRRCSRLTPDEVAAREAAKLPRAIRFKVPPGETTFHDLVHGDITFDNAHIEDFVALRSDGHPTYHLSVVADDIDMAITHVVRGDDHISNTPKQVLLYRAFGKPLPAFAHVPLILGPDKRRLSKRHGATSVTEYSRQGFLPEAMMNFLALLGWSPGNDQESVLARRAGCGVLARGHQQQQRGLQPREARVVQRAAHRAHAGGGAGPADRAAAARGRLVARRLDGGDGREWLRA